MQGLIHTSTAQPFLRGLPRDLALSYQSWNSDRSGTSSYLGENTDDGLVGKCHRSSLPLRSSQSEQTKKNPAFSFFLWRKTSDLYTQYTNLSRERHRTVICLVSPEAMTGLIQSSYLGKNKRWSFGLADNIAPCPWLSIEKVNQNCSYMLLPGEGKNW